MSSAPSAPSFTAAPKVSDFTPPEPTPEDPYPGYYLLPSGQWAAYDMAYYQKFYRKWKKEYDDHVRALEKGTVKGFEGAEEQAEEVNALEEMERAKLEIQEREERKALTTAAAAVPAAPKMNIKVRGITFEDHVLPFETSTRVPHSVGGLAHGINCQHFSLKPTRTVRLWKRRLRWGGETARRLVTSMVSGLTSLAQNSFLTSVQGF